jgi:hypothetical protein
MKVYDRYGVGLDVDSLGLCQPLVEDYCIQLGLKEHEVYEEAPKQRRDARKFLDFVLSFK